MDFGHTDPKKSTPAPGGKSSAADVSKLNEEINSLNAEITSRNERIAHLEEQLKVQAEELAVAKEALSAQGLEVVTETESPAPKAKK